MIDMIKALKHCHSQECEGCPYEYEEDLCKELPQKVEEIYSTIGEFIGSDTLQNIIKKGKEWLDESKD